MPDGLDLDELSPSLSPSPSPVFFARPAAGPAADPAPPAAPDPDPWSAEDRAAEAALRDLLAAGLVSHEAIGDPARLAGGERAALAGLCRQVDGPVYRIAPFHYAFAAAPAAAADLPARLAADLGPEALWTGPLDRPQAAEAAAIPPAAVLMLRARAAATEAGLAVASPQAQAVIDARYAADCARLTVEAAGLLGAALEARLERGLAAAAAAQAAFEERLGLALAEFLARLERHAAEAEPAAAFDATPGAEVGR